LTFPLEDGVVNSETEITHEFLDAYAQAWNCHDVDGILAAMTEDCVMETSAGPEVWGRRFRGQAEVRQGIEALFWQYPEAQWLDARHFISESPGRDGMDIHGNRIRRSKNRIERMCRLPAQ